MFLVPFSDVVHSGAKYLTDNGYLVTCLRLPQGFVGARILETEKNSHFLKTAFFFLDIII